MKKLFTTILFLVFSLSLGLPAQAEITNVQAVTKSGLDYLELTGSETFWGKWQLDSCQDSAGNPLAGCLSEYLSIEIADFTRKLPDYQQGDFADFFGKKVRLRLNFDCAKCASRSELDALVATLLPVKLTNVQLGTLPLNSSADFLGIGNIYSDTRDHDYWQAINYLNQHGIASGYDDDTFRPNQLINRAEFTKIIIESRFSDEQIFGANCFSDVANEWFAKYVCTAKREGIIDGYSDGTFRPSANINFVEAAKIIAPTTWTTNLPDQLWYYPHVKILSDNYNIPSSIQSFGQHIKRGEMAEMIYRQLENITTKLSKSLYDLDSQKALAADQLLAIDWSYNSPKISYGELVQTITNKPLSEAGELVNYFGAESNYLYQTGIVQTGTYQGFELYTLHTKYYHFDLVIQLLKSPDNQELIALRKNGNNYVTIQGYLDSALTELGFTINNSLVLKDLYSPERIEYQDQTLIRNRTNNTGFDSLDFKAIEENLEPIDGSQYALFIGKDDDNLVIIRNSDSTYSSYRKESESQ
jgi:hypothetical protein